MRRNRFDEIMQNFHLADNNHIDVANDKFAKVRPLFHMLNNKCMKYFKEGLMEQELSIDESMVPYFGHHSTKQFIKGKPIRFGYKMWSMNTTGGYLVSFDPYQGKNLADRQQFGVGGNVVLRLIAGLPEDGAFQFTFDNYFTSLRLVDELSHQGKGATGTIRENRTEKCPVKSKKIIKKEARGSFDFRRDATGHLILCEWNDNSVVSVVSNCHPVHPLHNAARWSRGEQERINIQQPNLIFKYNKTMGGTDRMDQNIAKYRSSIRSKKWWWPLFSYSMEIMVNNAWLLGRGTDQTVNEHRDLLSFRRYIVQVYLRRYQQHPRIGAACLVPNDRRVLMELRYDNTGHLIVTTEGRPRCDLEGCTARPTTKCIKCEVGLCVKCFQTYHTL